MPPRRDLRAALAAAPLDAAIPALKNGGLRLVPANQVSIRQQEHPKVGIRVFLQIRFFDADTKQRASSSNVSVSFIDRSGIPVAVPLTESLTEMGLYTGSFVFTSPGEWRAMVFHGSMNEVADDKSYYVVAS